jgi:aspartyl-tRNA synthetase
MTSVAELDEAAQQKGAAVRELKAAGADKAAVETAVAELQVAKAALAEAVQAAMASIAKDSPEYAALQAKLPAPAKPKGKDKKPEADAGGAAPQDAKKAARAAQRLEAEKAQAQAKDETVLGPTLSLPELDSSSYGNLFIQSQAAPPREWTAIPDLAPSFAGQKVWLRVRVGASRKQGKALCFLQLRQSMATVQAVVFSKDSPIVGFAACIPKESVVDVYGEITTPKDPVTSCSQSSVEIQVQRLYCVSRAVQVPIHTPVLTPFCILMGRLLRPRSRSRPVLSRASRSRSNGSTASHGRCRCLFTLLYSHPFVF